MKTEGKLEVEKLWQREGAGRRGTGGIGGSIKRTVPEKATRKYFKLIN